MVAQRTTRSKAIGMTHSQSAMQLASYGPSLMAAGTHLPKPSSAEVCSRYAP